MKCAVRPRPRADVAALSAAVQGLSVIKKVRRGVVTPTSTAEVVVTVSAIDVNKAFMTLLTKAQNTAVDRGTQNIISAQIINSTSIGIKAFTVVESLTIVYTQCPGNLWSSSNGQLLRTD